ncbi:hypothetical protein GYMLUDRAFT_38527 [Collybiopsis luxurians FD-317 M1]|nr:hypothetical protein GYMLUDRAFT_38527 [Collybiopsis luxurians FD-317 M1]
MGASNFLVLFFTTYTLLSISYQKAQTGLYPVETTQVNRMSKLINTNAACHRKYRKTKNSRAECARGSLQA